MTFFRIKKIKNTAQGFTLIETLIYIAGLIVLIGVTAGFLAYIFNWYREITIPSRANQTGSELVARIGSDIRSAKALNMSQSAFDIGNGSLSLETINGTSTIFKKYLLQNGRILYQEGTGPIQPVSANEIQIQELNFHRISTPQSTAVRFGIKISYSTHDGTSTINYASLAILKNSYE